MLPICEIFSVENALLAEVMFRDLYERVRLRVKHPVDFVFKYEPHETTRSKFQSSSRLIGT